MSVQECPCLEQVVVAEGVKYSTVALETSVIILLEQIFTL